MMEGSKSGIREHEITELNNKKRETEQLIHSHEKRRLDLIKQIHTLERELHRGKKRYKQEQQLKYRSKKKLEEINQSHSWRLSAPIRKIKTMFKKSPYRSHITDANAIKEVFAERTSARDLDRKLWAGYASYALKELYDLKSSPDAPLNERLRATRSIARWYFDREMFDKAYKELEYINEVKPLNHPNPDRVITEIKVLKKLNNIYAAKRKVWETIKARGLQSELCLSMAHLADSEIERLTWYNLIYDMYGYRKIKKLDMSKPLDLENLCSTSSTVERVLDNYRVSVIIPAYNASTSIHIALDSLLRQTIPNLEIIVVDDCSLDHTAEVVEKYASKDQRIKLIKKQKNEGAYAARNTGLQYITGDFITVHDSDDWSHPEKIEVQLKALLRNPKAVGSISFLARTTKDVTPINAGSLLGSKFLTMNSSSLLIRRSICDQLGGWDSVRVAGDSEFIWRIEKVFGSESIIRVEQKVPLSLALSAEGSLTGASATHVKTIMFGLRRTYREAFEWWHNQAESINELYLDPKKVNRKFPCPFPNRIFQTDERFYDNIFIADFSNGSDINKLIYMLEFLTSDHGTNAIFHWPHYNGNPYNKVADDVFKFINQKEIDILVPHEEVKTGKLTCLTPGILDYALEVDSTPDIKCKQAYIILDETVTPENKQMREENFTKSVQTYAEWCNIKDF